MRRIVETHGCASLACVSSVRLNRASIACVSTVRLCNCHNTYGVIVRIGSRNDTLSIYPNNKNTGRFLIPLRSITNENQ
jgi:hypothetical protein